MRKSPTKTVSFWKTGDGVSFAIFATVVTPLVVGPILTMFGIL